MTTYVGDPPPGLVMDEIPWSLRHRAQEEYLALVDEGYSPKFIRYKAFATVGGAIYRAIGYKPRDKYGTVREGCSRYIGEFPRKSASTATEEGQS